jgi:hypothetical protein
MRFSGHRSPLELYEKDGLVPLRPNCWTAGPHFKLSSITEISSHSHYSSFTAVPITLILLLNGSAAA